MKKVEAGIIAAVAIFLLAYALSWATGGEAPCIFCQGSDPLTEIGSDPLPQATSTIKDTIKVTRIIDGDTIELETGEKLRYIGIDTPETVDPRRGVECFGKEANEKNKELVLGKEVRLEKDVSDTDRYDRLLRYVYVDNTFINLELVRLGYASASSYPPDVMYQEAFREAEREAREAKRGLWTVCK